MKEILTIFTPTYNRAYTLSKCYESLCRQKNKKFKWLIVDDGSEDNTYDLVKKWSEECDFEIKYIYKKNGGMHTAHNVAYENIDTELNMCIDSDDYITDDSIEKILKVWNTVKKNKNIAGIIGLDVYKSGDIVGSEFPNGINQSTLFDLYKKYNVKGDKKLIYRTELTRKYRYPEFKNEKYVGLDYKYHKIDLNYKLYLLNEPLCVVEYMEDGSSKNMLKQYKNNPKGWIFYRKENLKRKNTGKIYLFKEATHYVSSSIIIKNRKFLLESPRKIITLLSIPSGIFLYLYIKLKTKE